MYCPFQPSFLLPANCSLTLARSPAMASPATIALFFILISAMFPQPRTASSLQHNYPYPQELINRNRVMSPTLSPSESVNPPMQPTPDSPPRVPALFVIGDSTVDCGTNNFLGTFARANRAPYGRDFDTHVPTGRFCNGRIPVDYLGKCY